mgnify:CR=1 FL=1
MSCAAYLLALSPFASTSRDKSRESGLPILMGSSPVDQQYEVHCHPAGALCMFRILRADGTMQAMGCNCDKYCD